MCSALDFKTFFELNSPLSNSSEIKCNFGFLTLRMYLGVNLQGRHLKTALLAKEVLVNLVNWPNLWFYFAPIFATPTHYLSQCPFKC